MFNARKFPVATVALAAWFGILGSSTAIAGCVSDDVPAGAYVGNDGLGGMGGAPLSLHSGGAGGLTPYEHVEAEAGVQLRRRRQRSATAQAPAGDEGTTRAPAPPTATSQSAQTATEHSSADRAANPTTDEPGGAECVTTSGAPYVAKSC